MISNARRDRIRRGRARVHRFRPTEPLSTYLVALIAGPYARWEDVYSDDDVTIPLGVYCRASLAEHMDPERVFTETKQGFAFYHRNFGRPTRSASTTSSSSPSSTPRHGERRPPSPISRTTSPVQGDQGPLRAPRRDRAARDGAHVVRRPRHHAVVG